MGIAARPFLSFALTDSLTMLLLCSDSLTGLARTSMPLLEITKTQVPRHQARINRPRRREIGVGRDAHGDDVQIQNRFEKAKARDHASRVGREQRHHADGRRGGEPGGDYLENQRGRTRA